MQTDDQRFIRRAIELASRGRGDVEPNPMVGCVIAKEGRVIGEGFHKKFGEPHAEREALSACTESPQGATVYVNLEPCCHTNKKTPPCVPALIEAGVKRVVVGCVDPNPLVSGRGIEELKRAGIRLDVGIDEAEAKQLNAAFFAKVLHGRPYVTLKWAQSADGKVAGKLGQRMQISNELSMRIVHELRGRSDAILVGIGTVLADDPTLLPRGVEKRRPLIRAVMDSRLRTPIDSKLVKTTGEGKVIVYCSAAEIKGTVPFNEIKGTVPFIERGVEVVPLAEGRMGRISPKLMMEDLAKRGVTHLLVDAGPTLGQSLIDQNLADRVWVIHSKKVVGEKAAPDAPVAPWRETASLDLGGDRLVEMLNQYGEVFFAASPSADLLWVRQLAASP